MPRPSAFLLATTAFMLAVQCGPCALLAKDDSDNLWGEHWKEDLAAWHHAKGRAAKRRLGEALITSAMRSDHPETVDAVLAGGERRLRNGEIRVPRHGTQRIVLTEVQTFPELHHPPDPYNPAEGNQWLTRRITQDAFEVWSPRYGWLFDSRGQLLNEAHPPRRDGVGREWYGAFLPDGRWVTTDLWEWDRVLTFFSREGKWLKEISGAALLPHTAKDDDPGSWHGSEDDLITWARSDKEGRGWIVQVGANGGRGRVWIGPDGSAQPLADGEDMGWTRCYPRQLGPRGDWYNGSVPDDSGKLQLGFSVPGHGCECSYPTYRISDSSDERPGVLVADGERNYGFWPGSTNFFVVSPHDLPAIKGEYTNDPATSPASERTWFFDRDADFLGWIGAARLADGADGRTMLFCTPDNRVVTLDRRQRVRRVQRFMLPVDGGGSSTRPAVPLALFADLHLGVFGDGNRIVLARWNDNKNNPRR